MAYRELAENTKNILCLIDAAHLSQKVAKLFDGLRAPGQKVLDDAFECYVSIAHKLLRAVAVDGRPSQALYAQLRKLRRDAQHRLEIAVHETIPSGGWERQVLDTLHYMGGLERLESKGAFSFWIVPDTLALALRLLSVLDGPARRKHLKEIAALRGDDMAPTQIQNLDDSVLSEVAGRLGLETRREIARLMRWRVSEHDLDAVRVQILPTATDFYEAGIRYYQQDRWRHQGYYIFATTSGVVLPEEHHGSDFFRRDLVIPSLYETCGKHPIRERYFKVLAGSAALHRMYFYEEHRASVAYRQTLEDIKREAPGAGIDATKAVKYYKSTALKSIESFLRRKRFGLIRVNYFPRTFDHLTLGNGRATLISARDPGPVPKIGHGFMLTPKPGWVSQVKQLLSGETLLRDLVPKRPPGEVATDSLFLLASAGIRAFIPIIIGAFRGASRKERVRRATDILERLQEEVKRSIHCEVIDWPDRRIRNVTSKAEDILERLEEGVPVRPSELG